MENLNFPKIGLRTIKSSIAVFLCLALLPNEPFFACLTSVFCIQDTVENSFTMAKNRSIGTIFGATIGLLILFLFRVITKNIDSIFIKKLIIYTFIALGIIIVIHFNNMFLKMPGAVNISCIAFLAVTTAHAYSDPIFYSANRIFETLCGMIIGLLVNILINPPKHS